MATYYLMKQMVLSEGQRKILNIVAEKSGRNPGNYVFDTAIIQASGLPASEVNAYLGQLQGLGLLNIDSKAKLLVLFKDNHVEKS